VGAAVTQASTTNTKAVAQATVAAANKNTAATANVLASAQVDAAATGRTNALAQATVQAFGVASGSEVEAVSKAWAQVCCRCDALLPVPA